MTDTVTESLESHIRAQAKEIKSLEQAIRSLQRERDSWRRNALFFLNQHSRELEAVIAQRNHEANVANAENEALKAALEEYRPTLLDIPEEESTP